MPMTVCPFEARNSFGAYWASLATASVPFDLYFAGTCDATAATVPPPEVDVVEVAAVELVLDLLLPHPAIARTTSTGTPARARTLIIETEPPEGLSRTVRSRPRKYRSAPPTFESCAAPD